MRIPISKREAEEMRQELAQLEGAKLRLGRHLGEIMSSSGSFATKTPGYPETEDRIRVIDQKISELRDLLSGATIIQDGTALPSDRIGVYSKVIARAGDGTVHRYYICYRAVPPALSDFQPVTPFSPLARALTSKKAGDIVTVDLPKGKRELEILEVDREL